MSCILHSLQLFCMFRALVNITESLTQETSIKHAVENQDTEQVDGWHCLKILDGIMD